MAENTIPYKTKLDPILGDNLFFKSFVSKFLQLQFFCQKFYQNLLKSEKHEKVQYEIKRDLKIAKFVSLALGCWISVSKMIYQGLTNHFIKLYKIENKIYV